MCLWLLGLSTSGVWKLPGEGDLLFSCDLFFLCVLDIAQLRKKFEEDKQRIALMRAQRKFRPY